MSILTWRTPLLRVGPISRCISSGRKTYYEKKFNLQEREKILKILNESEDSKDFVGYNISGARIRELLKWRNEYSGEFKSLEDLLPGFDRTVLSKFYNSILGKEDDPPKERGNGGVPYIPETIIKEAKKVVSTVFTGNFVSWTLIEKDTDGDLSVKLFEQREFLPSTPGSKSQLLTTLDQIKDIVKIFPPCDACIIEENILSRPNSFNTILLQNCQAKSMFLAYLSAQPTSPKILTFKPSIVAKTFRTIVGKEKVSGQNIVEDFLEARNELCISSALKTSYNNYSPLSKEYLSDAILLNIAYWIFTKQLGDPYNRQSIISSPKNNSRSTAAN